jgi:hypothetical protein
MRSSGPPLPVDALELAADDAVELAADDALDDASADEELELEPLVPGAPPLGPELASSPVEASAPP